MKKETKNSIESAPSRYELLKGVFEGIPEKISGRELHRTVKKYSRIGNEGFFPIGTHGSYIFYYPTISMLSVDKQIPEIVGISKEELLIRPIYDWFSRIVVPEHVYASARLAELSFNLLCKHTREDVVISTEYNIISPGQKSKRLVFQYRVVSRNTSGIPVVSFGQITDFTHIVSGGPPRMTVMIDGRLEAVYHAKPEEILAGIEQPLTHKELSVLLLKQKGYRTKEIATALRMKELSIYSIIRDIKRKTGMDTLPLIRMLQDKGAIQP